MSVVDSIQGERSTCGCDCFRGRVGKGESQKEREEETHVVVVSAEPGHGSFKRRIRTAVSRAVAK